MTHRQAKPFLGGVFLDRDGTIAEHVPYLRRPDDCRLLPQAGEAVALLNRAGLPVIIISNQSAVARGFVTIEALEGIHQVLRTQLAQYGAWLDGIFYCPHHPDEGCACRKPRTGLFTKAAADLGVSLAHSFMVGDQEIDILAGRVAGTKTILVRTGPPPGPDCEQTATPDHSAATLYEAVPWILQEAKRIAPRGRRTSLGALSAS